MLFPLPEMLFLSLLNYQTHPLQSCSHFIFSGEKSAFPPGMIRDPILCVLTSLINYSRIGKCKCSCAFADHKLLRIFKSLFSTLCPQHMIQNRHSIHTFITKENTGDLVGNDLWGVLGISHSSRETLGLFW